jgi:cytochrome c oxidase assembly factor CtaG
LPIPPEHNTHLGAWSFPLLLTFALVTIALVYLRGWLRLRNRSSEIIPAWRAAAFACGLFFLWIAVGSSICALDHASLTVHMINHLLLMVVVAPLILAGTPGLLLLRGLPARFGDAAHGFLTRNRQTQRLARLLTHPIFCWLFATATVIGWHLPAVFHLTMRSRGWHDLEYGCFVLAGLLFWLLVIQPVTTAQERPRWSTPVYLFLATLPCDILSAFLVFCGRVVYPSYLSSPLFFNLSPLQDQQCAGALMWVSVTFAYLLPAVVVTMRMLSPSDAGSLQPEFTISHPLAPPPGNGSQAEVV